MTNHSIRKYIIIGMFVLGIFALAQNSANQIAQNTETNTELEYYPITQTANVLSAAEAPEEKPDPVSDLEKLTVGDSNPTVYIVEVELNKKGFFSSLPNTEFEQETIDGIRMFQKSQNLEETGTLNLETLALLLQN